MNRRRAINATAAGLLGTALLSIAGCAGNQSALDPAGVQANRIYGLWHLFNWVCLVVYILSMGFVVLTLLRRRKLPPHEGPMQDDGPTLQPDPKREARAAIGVASALGITAAILFTLLVSDFVTARQIHSLGDDPNPLEVKIIGHQWWWDVQYQDPIISNQVMTANEMHIPVGRTIRIDLDSADVIHSFWIPNLTGKKDMVPGHPVSMWFRADKPGTYVGNCAEFCGFEHARMRFVVYADPQDKFDAWLHARQQPPSEPTTELEKRGRDVFLASSCVLCHAIGGTTARSHVGPELTDIGARGTIAAGWMANTPGDMENWITHTQDIKPGVRMPPTTMPADDLKALVAYLEGRK